MARSIKQFVWEMHMFLKIICPRWKEELDNKVFSSDGRTLPCILLANKVVAE